MTDEQLQKIRRACAEEYTIPALTALQLLDEIDRRTLDAVRGAGEAYRAGLERAAQAIEELPDAKLNNDACCALVRAVQAIRSLK